MHPVSLFVRPECLSIQLADFPILNPGPGCLPGLPIGKTAHSVTRGARRIPRGIASRIRALGVGVGIGGAGGRGIGIGVVGGGCIVKPLRRAFLESGASVGTGGTGLGVGRISCCIPGAFITTST